MIGKKIRLEIERFISLDNLHLMTFSYSITPLNFSGRVEITSEIDGHVENVVEKKPEIGSLEGVPTYIVDKGRYKDIGFVTQCTRISKFLIASGIKNMIKGNYSDLEFTTIPDDKKVIHMC